MASATVSTFEPPVRLHSVRKIDVQLRWPEGLAWSLSVALAMDAPDIEDDDYGPKVLDDFRATGAALQTRMNGALLGWINKRSTR